MSQQYKKVIFDNIHGYITLNRVESRILETPYYQRLRWIKQLGFSFYVYPGATHTRHAHALGVLHVMDNIIKSIGLAANEDKLFDPKARDERTTFHRMMRLAAMLHDIGTFPFSHTTELAYINHWREQNKIRKTKKRHNHEVLGKNIILHTDFPDGITKILKEEGIDPIELADIISGQSRNMLANQLMHSDVDADRMDYLLRDAYHTGIKLGVYDLEFLIRNLDVVDRNKKQYLAIHEEAINVVDSFLISRYFWYSQIILDGTGYKFDLIAAKIHQYFLENGLAHSFDHLVDSVIGNPNSYFTFNDSYFMALLHEYLAGRIRHPMIGELSEMLARRIPPAQIKAGPVKPTIVQNLDHRQKVIEQVTEASDWLVNVIKEEWPEAWVIVDVPSRDMMFTVNRAALSSGKNGKKRTIADLLNHRDAAKILTREGELRPIIDMSNSLMSILNNYRNFFPRIYVSPKTRDLLEQKKILDKLKDF